jgi:hypothetical protein
MLGKKKKSGISVLQHQFTFNFPLANYKYFALYLAENRHQISSTGKHCHFPAYWALASTVYQVLEGRSWLLKRHKCYQSAEGSFSLFRWKSWLSKVQVPSVSNSKPKVSWYTTCSYY